MTLVSIIERNLIYAPEVKDRRLDKEVIRLILKHIHQNLQNPEKLTLSCLSVCLSVCLSETFNMSRNKVGAYFKQETGHSVKQFINATRMTVISEKVAHSELSFSEIAFDFGFDESHFNKSFKKRLGMTPSEYRKIKLNE